MADKYHPTPDELGQLLDYDPDTGMLTWRARDLKWFPSARTQKMWNTRYAGKRAFCQTDKWGYLYGIAVGGRYLAHRVIYALHHGRWPTQEIDHINRIKTDNRASNLRDVSRGENERNKDRRPKLAAIRSGSE